MIIYEQPISAETLVGQDGLMIGNRRIRAQLWNDGVSLQIPPQTPQIPQASYTIPHQLNPDSERPAIQRRFTFDPFSQATFDQELEGVTQNLTNTSLKADSSPFIPSTTTTKSIPTFRTQSMITMKSPSPLQTLRLNTPQNQIQDRDATSLSQNRRPSPPESQTSEERLGRSGRSTSNNSASASASASVGSVSIGSNAKESDKTNRTDGTEKTDGTGGSSTDETQVSSQSVPAIPEKRFDRWLRAGMGGDDKWFKSAAW